MFKLRNLVYHRMVAISSKFCAFEAAQQSLTLPMKSSVWNEWNFLQFNPQRVGQNQKDQFQLVLPSGQGVPGAQSKTILIQSERPSLDCLATISWTPLALMYRILKTRPLWHPHPIQIENYQINLLQGLETCHFGRAGHMTLSSCSASIAKRM